MQLGTLQTGGRNEFNSSFYTVIELPPLNEIETRQLLERRGYKVTTSESRALCLISAGNQRELVRIADATLGKPNTGMDRSEDRLIVLTMTEEKSALLKEIIKIPAGRGSKTLSLEAKSGASDAFPSSSFQSVERFVPLGKNALSMQWEPIWSNSRWSDSVSESWRRLLVRLFVSASFLELSSNSSQNGSTSLCQSGVADLLKVMIMASQDASLARLMLEARFGPSLTGQYQAVPDS